LKKRTGSSLQKGRDKGLDLGNRSIRSSPERKTGGEREQETRQRRLAVFFDDQTLGPAETRKSRKHLEVVSRTRRERPVPHTKKNALRENQNQGVPKEKEITGKKAQNEGKGERQVGVIGEKKPRRYSILAESLKNGIYSGRSELCFRTGRGSIAMYRGVNSPASCISRPPKVEELAEIVIRQNRSSESKTQLRGVDARGRRLG